MHETGQIILAWDREGKLTGVAPGGLTGQFKLETAVPGAFSPGQLFITWYADDRLEVRADVETSAQRRAACAMLGRALQELAEASTLENENSLRRSLSVLGQAAMQIAVHNGPLLLGEEQSRLPRLPAKLFSR